MQQQGLDLSLPPRAPRLVQQARQVAAAPEEGCLSESARTPLQAHPQACLQVPQSASQKPQRPARGQGALRQVPQQDLAALLLTGEVSQAQQPRSKMSALVRRRSERLALVRARPWAAAVQQHAPEPLQARPEERAPASI